MPPRKKYKLIVKEKKKWNEKKERKNVFGNVTDDNKGEYNVRISACFNLCDEFKCN